MTRCPANSPVIQFSDQNKQFSLFLEEQQEAVAMSEKMVATQPRPFIMTTVSNQWTSGICDCLQDLPQCCFAFWCFPCFTCKTAHEAGECLCLPLLDAFGVIPPMTTALRVSVRQRYGIEGTVCNDCVYACFCGPCTWCQIAREIKTRTNPITFIGMAA